MSGGRQQAKDQGNDSNANIGKLTILGWPSTQRNLPTLLFESKDTTLHAPALSASEKACQGCFRSPTGDGPQELDQKDGVAGGKHQRFCVPIIRTMDLLRVLSLYGNTPQFSPFECMIYNVDP